MRKQIGIVFILLLAVTANAFASEVLQQLVNASKAGDAASYSGNFVVTRGSGLKSMQISHAVIDDVRHEKLKPLSGVPSEIIRIGSRQLSLRVGENLAALNGGFLSAFAGDFRNLSEEILQFYDVTRQADAMVAGRQATRISIKPKDRHRFGYAVWVDEKTGMILKSGMLRGDGKLLKVFEFVDLDVLDGMKKADFQPSLKGEYKSREIAVRENSKLKTTGDIPVSLSWLPEGFKLTSYNSEQSKDGLVYSQLYSDGLAAFTVFVVESTQKDKQARLSRFGTTVAATRELSQGGKSYDVTVVGELPGKTVKKMLQALKQ